MSAFSVHVPTASPLTNGDRLGNGAMNEHVYLQTDTRRSHTYKTQLDATSIDANGKQTGTM